MMLRIVIACLLAASPALASPVEKRSSTFTWGSDKLRGVNIGGWLVLEPFITPSIFQSVDQSLGIVDEYTLTEKLPKDAPGILKKHWDTWATSGDFQKIASAGFNLVRIPIGYWAYDNAGSPYVTGAAPYIDAAIDWARSTNPPLKVIIDLHGAPKSQNGFDNSGQRMEDPGWLVDGGVGGASTQRTLGVLSQIAGKYAKPEYKDVVVGIELLNEPFGPKLDQNELKKFSREGFNRVRGVSDTTVVIQDGFLAPSSYNGFLTPSDNNAQNVAIDHHEYQVFDNNLVGMQPWQHRQQVCNGVHSYTGADHWTFVGEWTAAMTDCAPFLNGYGKGARFDGTFPGSTSHGSCAPYANIKDWTDAYKDDTRGYIEAQMEAFEQKTQGWVFWNFKTEAASEWSLFTLLDAGVFPNPVSSRKFGAICTN